MRAQAFGIVGIQAPLIHVPHDAYDLRGFASAVQVEAFADGVLSRKELARQNLINNRYARRVLIVSRSKESASPDRDAHDTQVVGSDYVIYRPIHFVLGCRLRLAVNPEEPLVIPT